MQTQHIPITKALFLRELAPSLGVKDRALAVRAKKGQVQELILEHNGKLLKPRYMYDWIVTSKDGKLEKVNPCKLEEVADIPDVIVQMKSKTYYYGLPKGNSILKR